MWAWCATLAGAALATRFIPFREGGHWHLLETLAVAAIALVAIAFSLYVVYVLEIVKLNNPRRLPARERRERAAERRRIRLADDELLLATRGSRPSAGTPCGNGASNVDRTAPSSSLERERLLQERTSGDVGVDRVVGVAGHEEDAQAGADERDATRRARPPRMRGITTSVTSRSMGSR